MRQWLRKHERPVGVAATLLLISAIASVIAHQPGQKPQTPRPQSSRSVYFLDLATNKLLPFSASVLAPASGRNGGECVRAFVWSCGDCSEQGRRIGWLEKYTAEAKKASDPDAHPGHLIKAVDDARWFSYTDKKERGRIMSSMTQAQCEQGSQPGPCEPPQSPGGPGAL